jgi:protein-tyrosine phosphatase
MNTPPLPQDAATASENTSACEPILTTAPPAPRSRLLVSASSLPDRTQQVRPADPQSWWRVPCQVSERVFVSGDLDTFRPERAAAQLQEWLDLGITDIIDVRDEWSDADYVDKHAPSVRYHHLGTDDLGNGQPAEWFAAGVAAAVEALKDPQRRVMVHCHMGVNRGPSMAFAILLALGMGSVEALDAIRQSRPIAGIIYASDALKWWHHSNNTPRSDAASEQLAVQLWHVHNAVDVSWIVSRIHNAGRAS